MALPLIKLLTGYPIANPSSAFFGPLYGGDLEPPTTTQIVVSNEFGYRLIFTGSFTVAGGDVTGGTVTGFETFAGATKMETGSGFAIDGAALFDALQLVGTDSDPFFDLFDGAGQKIVGSKYIDEFGGTEFGDKLIGRAGNDYLHGQEGDDLIKGGKGNDTLFGEEGVDTLYGGQGDDVFSFSLDPENPPVGFDKIKDFEAGADTIGLDVSFDELPPGILGKEYFHKGTEATTAEQVIIYDKATGRLFFDVDGTGIEAQFQFAKVTPGTKLGAGDFMVDGIIMF
jgi:Ca2+-binding RTX toxin-like protein